LLLPQPQAVQARGHPSHRKKGEGLQTPTLFLFPVSARVETGINASWPCEGSRPQPPDTRLWHLFKVSGEGEFVTVTEIVHFTKRFSVNPACRHSSEVLNFICTTENQAHMMKILN